jgi:membrane protease YdiL (CAAX protease family)
VAVVLAPVLEEGLFRGLILRGLALRKGPRAATVWTAAFFAFFHFYNPWQILPTFFLGLLLGWVVLTTGSLWASIVLHSAFNGLSLVVFAFPVQTPDGPPALIVAGLILFLLSGSGALLAGMAWLEGMTGGGEVAPDYAPPPSERAAPRVRSGELGDRPAARG